MSSWYKIKRDKTDVLFSRYIRLKHKRCQRCGKVGTGSEGINGLQASHYFSRRMESVRFDTENVDCLDIFCHKYFTENRNEYTAWKFAQLGEKEYNLLCIRAKRTVKKDRQFQLIKIKALMNELC